MDLKRAEHKAHQLHFTTDGRNISLQGGTYAGFHALHDALPAHIIH